MKVKCIDTGGSPRLIIGKVYDVIKEDIDCYYIKDEQEESGWYKKRFEIVTDQEVIINKRVKCIDNSEAAYHLTIGQIYEVLEDAGGSFFVVRDDSGAAVGWYKNRFIIVADLKDNLLNKEDYFGYPAVKSSKPIDPEEDHCWKMMQPYIAPGNCKC